MSYRSSSPVSGFAGHVPGSKWQVGSRNSNLPNNLSLRSTQSEPEPTIISSDHSHTFDFEGNPIPRFSPYFFPQMTPSEYTQFYNQQMANLQQINGGIQQQFPNGMMPMYGFNPALSMNNGFPQNNGGSGMASSASMQGLNQSQLSPGNQGPTNGGQQRSNPTDQASQSQQQKARSKSMPRKPKSEVRDMFGGIESGWWSEGQALKNIRRHQQTLNEASGISGRSNGEFAADKASTVSRYRRKFGGGDDDDDDDVPTPGYSGHVPGMRTYGVGKPFTVAAKECRRKMHSNENSAIQEKAKSEKEGTDHRADNHSQSQNQNQQSQASRQQQFPQQYPQGMVNGLQPGGNPQQAFMNSYPYMTPNGFMQPMYMGLPTQGQQPQQQNPNTNQSNGF